MAYDLETWGLGDYPSLVEYIEKCRGFSHQSHSYQGFISIEGLSTFPDTAALVRH